ncbi:MAG: alpha/beta hydrolase [Rhodospirillales bacterium]
MENEFGAFIDMTTINLTEELESSCGVIMHGTSGDGPDVVLVHGTPTSAIVWDSVVERLRRRYRFHFLDLPGYGKSAKFEGQEVRLRSFARVLAEFIDRKQLANPVLVGHDFGAATVLGAHLKHGVPVSGLCITDGVVLSPWGTPFSRHVKQHEEIFAAVPEYVHEAVLGAHLRTAMAKTPEPDLIKALIHPWLGEVGQRAYYRQVGQYDYSYTEELETLYPSIDAPTFIIWGEQDRWVDVSEGARLNNLIPNSRLCLLPDSGHFAMLDSPGLFSRELDAWLAGVTAQ